tara:strand:- start:2685 stop:3041 length:357 start_codon:yes stop_codon:yes gene_type:complete
MRTSQLIDVALDWAVAECEGLLGFGYRDDMGLLRITLSTGETEYFKPTIDWSQGGPIIEREKISLWSRGKEWAAESFTPNELGHEETGKTPLIAAMRCYVASKLGDDVDVPTELTQGE